jgi:hypothetical protein
LRVSPLCFCVPRIARSRVESRLVDLPSFRHSIVSIFGLPMPERMFEQDPREKPIKQSGQDDANQDPTEREIFSRRRRRHLAAFRVRAGFHDQTE